MLDLYLLYNLLENRERTFFGHNYNEQNVVVFILFEDGISYLGKNYKSVYHRLPDNSTYDSVDWDNPVTHSDLMTIEAQSHEWLRGAGAKGRIWFGEKYPIIAIDDYSRECDRALFNLFSFLKIKGSVYVDNSSLFGSELSNPEKSLMPIKWIPKYLADN